jgi:iron complex transport system substrate-binding protein
VFYPIWLSKIVYPEKFSDVNLSDMLKQYFIEFFDYTLTDKQVSNILNGSYGSTSPAEASGGIMMTGNSSS